MNACTYPGCERECDGGRICAHHLGAPGAAIVGVCPVCFRKAADNGATCTSAFHAQSEVQPGQSTYEAHKARIAAEEMQRVRDIARANPHVCRDEQLVTDPHGNRYVACGFCGRERQDPAHIKKPEQSANPPSKFVGLADVLKPGPVEFVPVPPGMRASRDEKVDHPDHYRRGGIEAIDIIEAWGLGFCLGNAIKYLARAGWKPHEDAREALQKARWYIERQITYLDIADAKDTAKRGAR